MQIDRLSWLETMRMCVLIKHGLEHVPFPGFVQGLEQQLTHLPIWISSILKKSWNTYSIVMYSVSWCSPMPVQGEVCNPKAQMLSSHAQVMSAS